MTKTPLTEPLATPLHTTQSQWASSQSIHRTVNPSQPKNSVDPFGIPTVFVVDDDREMRESLELLLLAETLRVETYESADAFWEVFHPERCGCVVLDLRMPGMDGIALLERLAGHDHRLSVIVVSASANQGEKARVKELGAVNFLSKPYVTEQLLAAIREQLAR